MIELRQLRYFVAVAEDLHFSRAAERLHIAQPALSMQILALERQLGARLLDRTKRSVSLTAAGALFLAEAQLTLRQAEHTELVGRQAGRGELGRIEVGYTGSVPFSGVMSGTIRRFRQAHPSVDLVLTELSSPDQYTGLTDGWLDVGFIRTDYGHRPANINLISMMKEPYIVVLNQAHELAAHQAIPIAALATEPFIIYSPSGGSSMFSPVNEICEQAGFEPRMAQIVPQVATIVNLAAAGLGVALVPRSLSHLHIDGVAYRPLADVETLSELAFAHRRGEHAPAVMAFIHEARACAAEMQEMAAANPDQEA
ncbi:MAG TPA: LysR substrate-binding domain-containing protein [Aliidongia sp.]|nr:LysR substrate-binding domain-containing protein [Aliidongia sp.]